VRFQTAKKPATLNPDGYRKKREAYQLILYAKADDMAADFLMHIVGKKNELKNFRTTALISMVEGTLFSIPYLPHKSSYGNPN
jgi:hypothetical protein